MQDWQSRLSQQTVEDFLTGKLSRRQFLRRLTILTGSAVLGLSILGDLACGLSPVRGRQAPLSGEGPGLSSVPVASPDPPNILFVVIDTLRADHVSSYGYHRPTSPTLDWLAHEGALFEVAFATSPYTAPSHASLLTGLYPYAHGAQWNERRPFLDDRFPTLPQVLQARGYRTAAFSANHFYFTREEGFGRGFIRFEDIYSSPVGMAMRTVLGRRIEDELVKRVIEDFPYRIGADDINSSALSWLRRDPGRPFFAFLNYFDVHDPYLPPRPFRGQFSHLEEPGGVINSYQDRFNPEMTPEQLEEEMEAYDGAIAYVDDRLAQLLDRIGELGLGENLMVIVTSDHGEAFGEHGLFLHPNSVYMEEIRVPLIVWYPHRVPAGVRVAQPVSNATLPATVIDLLEDGEPEIFPQQSLARLWEHPEDAPQFAWPLVEMEHWPWWHPEALSTQGAMRSLISPELHYIEHEVMAPEIYDWRHDPREVHNLAETPEGQAAIDEFRELLYRVYPRG